MQGLKRGYVVRARYTSGDGSEKGVGYLTNGGAVSKTLRGAHVFASEADAWLYATSSGNIGSDEEGDFCWVSPSPRGTGEPDGLYTGADRCAICGAVEGTPCVQRMHEGLCRRCGAPYTPAGHCSRRAEGCQGGRGDGWSYADYRPVTVATRPGGWRPGDPLP